MLCHRLRGHAYLKVQVAEAGWLGRWQGWAGGPQALLLHRRLPPLPVRRRRC